MVAATVPSQQFLKKRMDFVPVRPAEGGPASRLEGVCSSILEWTSLQESCTAGDVNSFNLNKYLEV